MDAPVVNDTSARVRNNVQTSGNPSGRPIVFAHGFGCSQEMWRYVAPAFEENYFVVLYDQVGTGNSDFSAYDPGKYDSLQGYASDLLDILSELDLTDVVFVGHSVSSMIGVIASVREPDRFGAMVLVSPSARYINDGDYVGGFERSDIDSLLASLDANYVAGATQLAPLVMGNADRPELAEELTASFCRADPAISRHFAHVTFLSDNRRDLAHVSLPTVVLQCTDDSIAPITVGTYVHEQIIGSSLVLLEATGHCPNLSNPPEVISAIRNFLHE